MLQKRIQASVNEYNNLDQKKIAEIVQTNNVNIFRHTVKCEIVIEFGIA